MSYVKTVKDRDLIQTETTITDANGFALSNELIADYGADGTTDRYEVSYFSYDPMGRLASNETFYDTDANSIPNHQDKTTYEYDADGRCFRETTTTPDIDLDGNPDHSDVLLRTFTSTGLIQSNETKWYSNGVQSTADYRLETFTYTTDGQLDVSTIDDWAELDFVTGEDRDYDASGRIVSLARMDPFVYGDEAYHVTESWNYWDDGSVVYSNVTGQTEWGIFGALKTKLNYDTPTKTTELIEGLDATGAVVFRAKEEIWRNSFGEETDTLVSYDGNLDSAYTPGSRSGFLDGRDREKMRFADADGDGDRDLVYHSVDYGLNGVDYLMEVTPIDDMMIA